MGFRLSPTLEDYLEAIYRIESDKKATNPGDIAKARNVAKPTVTAALRSLARKSLIDYEPYEVVTLTAEGREYAKQLAMRRHALEDFLGGVLGMRADEARKTACGIEHSINGQVLDKLLCFLAFIKESSADERWWIEEFKYLFAECPRKQACESCFEKYMGANTLECEIRDGSRGQMSDFLKKEEEDYATG